jgi:hypothetical protein
MAVIKYKMLKNAAGRREVPGYVEDRGHWYDDTDGTYIGWLDTDAKFYVPADNAIQLTKEEFITRGTDAGHTTQPGDWDTDGMGEWTAPDLGAWYDQFVSDNS